MNTSHPKSLSGFVLSLLTALALSVSCHRSEQMAMRLTCEYAVNHKEEKLVIVSNLHPVCMCETSN